MADKGGDYTGKPRPALIVQADAFATDSVTLCPLTHIERDAPLLRLRLEASERLPLATTYWVQIDKVTTVRRSRLGPVIGRIPEETGVELNRLLASFLGIA
ncbi:type II toxin-antitoxin system PemK/MazF family toxin [Siccirubricoccus sp. G192]|uniref:type II toxin-antitoxin system PemK/MazF family toxin n=1 Tax=Siccirubricoccus sp. G192 TaxID=2849651 RepID=UPI002811D287|nr:type II toxin-antitoxin system PemK/MazF family toxin [Siccirubricoccus sp. G192]